MLSYPNRTPFVIVEGIPYLVVNFRFDDEHDMPPLPELLHGLLRHHHEQSLLLLRPMTHQEQRFFHRRQRDCGIEIWSHLVITDAHRIKSTP